MLCPITFNRNLCDIESIKITMVRVGVLEVDCLPVGRSFCKVVLNALVVVMQESLNAHARSGVLMTCLYVRQFSV